MKKHLKIFTLALAAFALSVPSCNYLDIVPDETPDEMAPFRDQYSTERYLYGCYSFMPKMYQYMQYNNTTELAWSKAGWGTGNIVVGTQTPTSLGQYTFWNRYYGAIKRCYQLLDALEGVPLMQEAVKDQYRGEAKFLIAYYHFQLMKAYGPIPIVDKSFPPTVVDVEAFPARSDINTCAQWISDLFDEAFELLPIVQPDEYYGRASGTVAKAMKAKMWLYVASPLFNGNTEFYSNSLIDPVTGEHLMPQAVDNSKWSKTLEYALEAARVCEQNGIALYYGTPDASIPEPSDPVQYRLRMTIPDRKTQEIIWADTRAEGIYDMQNNGTPRYRRSDGWTWNMNQPTLETVKRFYTKRGLPIEEDPDFVSEREYFTLGDYEGAQTAQLHIGREPRFYAWISFHNGWFELTWQGDEWGEGTTSNKRIRTKYRLSDPQGASTIARGNELRGTDFSNTGYLNKKFMHPLQNVTSSSINTFPYPIMRLGDLYLIIAEAAVETNDLATAKEYLNRIRTRAGIPTVEESWEGVAELTQSKLREIVRREREIELYLECDIMWDNKRWKTMHDLIPAGNGNPHGLNYAGITDAEFFREMEVKLSWRFDSPTHYLLPIPGKDVDIIPDLIQNPGY